MDIIALARKMTENLTDEEITFVYFDIAGTRKHLLEEAILRVSYQKYCNAKDEKERREKWLLSQEKESLAHE